MDPPQPRARRSRTWSRSSTGSGGPPPTPRPRLRPVRVGSRRRELTARRQPPDDDAGRSGRGRPEPRTASSDRHADRRPPRRRGRQPRRHDRPLRLPPDHPRAGQHVGDARVPGDREARRRGGARRASASSCRARAATSGRRELFVPELATYRRLGAMLGHEAAATAFRASWRAHRQRLREGEASAWIASFEYEPDDEPDGTVAVAAETLPLPLRDDLGDPARGGSRPSDARTRPTRHGPPARRRPRCASSPCGRSSPGCAPSAARRSTASTPTRCSSTGSGSGRSRCSASRSSSSARSGRRSATRRPSRTTLVVGLLERLSQLPADRRGAAARRLRDRHLAIPARRGRARDGLGGPRAGGAAMSRWSRTARSPTFASSRSSSTAQARSGRCSSPTSAPR